ncbi:MAG: hypothetical protein H0A76_05705 [Candidatus Thiodubiliella endoseptemdiera]|uniref:Uncharacterized protein n=1 Tax=Candidatus Thiodubiliella endoseptemdiera TaxID=2738886 RepID=A0A853F0H7_9GAMM|nr:hypothetical protein [Candidatus Thiodubiliella endoseptemdiera]
MKNRFGENFEGIWVCFGQSWLILTGDGDLDLVVGGGMAPFKNYQKYRTTLAPPF